MGKWIALLGGLAAVAGLTLGLSPMQVEGVSCGSAFKASRDARVADIGSTLVGGIGPGNISARCDDRRVERKPFAIVLLVGGLVAAAAGGMIAAQPRDSVKVDPASRDAAS
jgi:hypothetical protein